MSKQARINESSRADQHEECFVHYTWVLKHRGHNLLFASSGLVGGLDFNNMLDGFSKKVVRKKYLV